MCLSSWAACRDTWPDSYWDDWIRLNTTRRGRQCIRPEVCRNFNFGEKGSSKGLFYRRFLKPIRLNDEDIGWMQQDLSYLNPERSGHELVARAAVLPLPLESHATKPGF